MFRELCFNLESFNPAFTSCLLMVQRTIGVSDYERRDLALKNLIQPLAGEYGMHNGQPQVRCKRGTSKASAYAAMMRLCPKM